MFLDGTLGDYISVSYNDDAIAKGGKLDNTLSLFPI